MTFHINFLSPTPATATTNGSATTTTSSTVNGTNNGATSVPTNGTTAHKPAAIRQSTSKPSATAAAKSDASKKTLPPTKSVSKLPAEQAAEDPKSKVITKRDPKPSTGKPNVAKTDKQTKSTDEAPKPVDTVVSIAEDKAR